jgi:DNA gyrase subunit B
MSDETTRATAAYDESQITVLEGLEAVRKRPGMYIGLTDVNGLHNMIREVVDNSVDEVLAGRATSVGVSVVNALSDYLLAEVHRNGRHYRQEYRHGAPQGDVEDIGPSQRHGTMITFLPDTTIFNTLDYNFKTLAQRFREMSYLTKGLRFRFVDERDDKDLNFYFEGGIVSYVRHLNKDKNVLHRPPFYVERTLEDVNVEVALQYTEAYDTDSIYAFANNINNADGGTHLTGFRTALTRVINSYARTKNILKENEANLTGDDVREGLTAVVSVKLREPQFNSQTKEKLVSPEASGAVAAVFGDAFAAWLEEHPGEGRKIIEKTLQAARTRLAVQKVRETSRKTAMDGFSLPGKLADCSDTNPARSELYIVEGDSAGGSAKQGRDRRFQAILPLRGKILNVEKSRLDKMLSNNEVRTLVTAIGTSLGETFDQEKLRYHRVVIMTDADVDGSHIRTLLLTFFYRYMRALITNGHLYIAQPPLYLIKNGKENVYVYSDAERDAYLGKQEPGVRERIIRNNGIQRYKGLGEMNAEQLWDTTMNPANRIILQVTLEDAVLADETFTMLMGDMVPPRRRFIQTHATEVRNLDV